MAKLTDKQIEFIGMMTRKQRTVLRSLSEFPFHMSASEHADQELAQLMRIGFARSYSILPDQFGPWMWSATDAGRTALKRIVTHT